MPVWASTENQRYCHPVLIEFLVSWNCLHRRFEIIPASYTFHDIRVFVKLPTNLLILFGNTAPILIVCFHDSLCLFWMFRKKFTENVCYRPISSNRLIESYRQRYAEWKVDSNAKQLSDSIRLLSTTKSNNLLNVLFFVVDKQRKWQFCFVFVFAAKRTEK